MSDQLKVEADAWLRRARDDLGAARKLLAGQDTYPATASYHCQQAAEKALKALLVADTAPIPKTHDLRVLIERCLLLEPGLDALRDACDELTPFATEFRYPTDARDSGRGFGAVLRRPGCAQNIRIVRPQADNSNQEDFS